MTFVKQNTDIFESFESMSYFPDGNIQKNSQPVLVEYRLIVHINDFTEFTVICTPTCLEEMVYGRLYTQRLIQKKEDITHLEWCSNEVFVKIRNSRSESLKNINNDQVNQCLWKPEWIFALTKKFKADMSIHKYTSGTHSCYLSYGGEIVFQCEDISRHNAVDKIVGFVLMNALLPERCLVFTTGRVPEDMIDKMINARIPVLVSKSVPTKNAIQLARRSHFTLICKAWPDRFELFSPL